MGQIISKLNLNQTPNLVDNNSLVFAKNIRVEPDGTIHRDYDISKIHVTYHNNGKPKNTLESIFVDFSDYVNTHNENIYTTQMYIYFRNIIGDILTKFSYSQVKDELEHNGEKRDVPKEDVFQDIVGVVADSNDFYLFIKGYFIARKIDNPDIKRYIDTGSLIVRYSEKDDKFYPCDCSWKYSGGDISGYVTTNLIGDKILSIGETSNTDILVPFKCINLNKSRYTDDESIYTQTPKIPFTNLDFASRFSYIIPNGVYQFFVRYKIRDNFYTNWFPASKECFAGNRNEQVTQFGTLTYNNTKKASDSSFVFEVHHLIKSATSNYKNFQIGFICSSDNGMYARAWKHFNFNQSIINFDYDSADAEEIEITDLLKVSYQIYNVGNVTSFKNKLYISNYEETNFNEDLQSFADKITINIKTKTGSSGYGNYSVGYFDTDKNYINSIDSQPISGEKGIIKIVLETAKNSNSKSVKDCLDQINNDNNYSYTNGNSSAYNIDAAITVTPLTTAKNKITENNENIIAGPTFDPNNSITSIIINKTNINSINKDTIIEHIYNKCKYLNKDGFFTDSDTNVIQQFDVKVYREYTLTKNVKVPNGVQPGDNNLTIDGVQSNSGFSQDTILNGGYHYEAITIKGTYVQDITIRLYADRSLLKTDTEDFSDYTTLIPYQKYKFYVHYVTANGEITNGYYCSKAGELEAPYMSQCDSMLYPAFNNIEIPSGYVSCFFSIFHYAINSSTVYDITEVKDANNNIVGYEGYCPDINCMLVPAIDDITCKQTNNSTIVEHKGTFNYSDSSIQRYFGACGLMFFNKEGFNFTIESDGKQRNAYAVVNYESNQDDDVELIKCTPFITESFLTNNTFDDYKNLNLGGYICSISMLDKKRTTEYYTDGTSVYKKDHPYSILIPSSDYRFGFKELSKYNNSSPSVFGFKELYNTIRRSFYSRYNLNYASLGGDGIKQTIMTSYNNEGNDSNVPQVSYTDILFLISSATSSDIYQLESMYRSYTRKTYSVYNKNSYTKAFNNTVRASNIEEDEAEFNIFKFDATDYYNVPANRGKIVNLVAVGDSILCHTKDSMFKFIGSNSLQSSEGEIVSTESTPFDTGISEMFGSDFGFAGIQNKKHCCITENGYIFYDSHAKVIYMYSGNGQIVKLSDSIKKLINYDIVSNICFANDYYHDRFFISIHYDNGKKATLSFSMLENVKSFISLHDFYFNNAFNTKTNCYFLSHNEKRFVFRVNDKKSVDYYDNLTFDDTLYPRKGHNSIIDVIVNDNIENVKTLNFIDWCCDNDYNELNNDDNSDTSTKLMLQHKSNNLNLSLVIYSDTCNSGVIACNNRSNDNINNYKAPRYNQGKWSLNYFRNIENTNNKDNSDNKSLIEGRYFVIRFIFGEDFRLESLTCNTNYKI